MIPRSEIEAVKERADIAEVINSYGITLKGSTTLKGLCPFHDESTPSFSVRPAFGTYRCFGCGAHGDVVSFVQEKDGFTFTESVKALAERYNIEVHDTATKEDEAERNNKRRLFEVMKAAAAFYARKYRELPQDHLARLELRKRDLEEVAGDPQWLDRFGIGYAPEGWTHTIDHLLSRGFTHEEIVTAGLAGRTESGKLYDLFRGRLLWQIRDVQGRVIGFGGRRLFDTDRGPKYLNSPQTPLYDKSRVLYGLDMARKMAHDKKEIIIVEGYTDVMALAAVGIDNAVAPCGTAFGDGHATLVFRMLGEKGKLIFNFDGDTAGQNAALKTFQLTSPIHNISYVTQAGNGDPCDIRQNEGDFALEKLVSPSNLIPLTEFVLKQELSKNDISTAEGRSSFLHAAAPMLSHITDYAMREDYIRKVTFWSGSTLDVVRSVMRGIKVSTTSAPASPNGEDNKNVKRGKQEALLSLMFQYPQEFYITIAGQSSPELESLFDEDLGRIYQSMWYKIRQSRGNLGKVTPDEFPDPDLVLEIMHKPLERVEQAETDKDRVKAVQSLSQFFTRALGNLDREEKIQDMRTRISQAYGDEKVGEDLSALSEILEQQKKLKNARRRGRANR